MPGQLDKAGVHIFPSNAGYLGSAMVDDGCSRKFGARQTNCLYILKLEIEQPVNFSARYRKMEDIRKRWMEDIRKR